MHAGFLALFGLAALAGCAILAPRGPYDPARFHDDPGSYGLVAVDVAAGTLAGWALVLRAEGGSEAIFRPPEGTRPPRGVATMARALPPGRWRPVRVMAVQDGRPCGAGADAPITRAVYPARLGDRAESFTLSAGEALYIGRLGISADLFACAGAQLTLRASAGAPTRAGKRAGAPLRATAPFAGAPIRLRAE